LLKETVNKKEFLKKLEGELAKAVEQQATCFLLYYSGHGDKDTGAWIVQPAEVTLNIEDCRI